MSKEIINSALIDLSVELASNIGQIKSGVSIYSADLIVRRALEDRQDVYTSADFLAEVANEFGADDLSFRANGRLRFSEGIIPVKFSRFGGENN